MRCNGILGEGAFERDVLTFVQQTLKEFALRYCATNRETFQRALGVNNEKQIHGRRRAAMNDHLDLPNARQ